MNFGKFYVCLYRVMQAAPHNPVPVHSITHQKLPSAVHSFP